LLGQAHHNNSHTQCEAHTMVKVLNMERSAKVEHGVESGQR